MKPRLLDAGPWARRSGGRQATRNLEPPAGAPQVEGPAAPAAPGRDAVRPLTDAEFELYQALVSRETGICLSDSKHALVTGRLAKRVRELGLRSFAQYYRLVSRDDPAELQRLIDLISTNETYFFREPRQFEHLRQLATRWLEEARHGARRKSVRVWSAACSTGEEPYSIAMTLLDAFTPHPGWDLEVLASDISMRALERAREGVWSLDKAQKIPMPFLQRYMLKGKAGSEGLMKARPLLRHAIRFARINLSEARYREAENRGPFDAIFCRNVLIYFDPATKRHVVHRLAALLAPGGELFLGHAESLTGLSDRLRSVQPSIYARGHGGKPGKGDQGT